MGMSRLLNYSFLGLLFVGFGLTPVQSQDSGRAIGLEIQSLDNPGLTFSYGSDDLLSVFDQLVARGDELFQFSGERISARVDYLGVADSLLIEVGPNGRMAEIYVPLTGLRVSFSEVSTSALQRRIEQYFREEGSAEIAKFRREVNKRSKVGITDGSPSSATALLARSLLKLSERGFATSWRTGNVQRQTFSVDYSHWRAGKLEGRSYFGRLEGGFETGGRNRVLYSLPFEYREFGSASIFSGSLGLGWQYDIVEFSEGSDWWGSVTPQCGMIIRGSEALAAGGGVASYGVTINAGRKTGKKGKLILSSQINGYNGIPLQYEGYELDSLVDQSIGILSISYERDLTSRLRANVGWVGTRFFKSAGVPSFHAIKVGVEGQLSRSVTWGLGMEYAEGSGFQETGWRCSLFW